ncbi:hypothetical protein SCLCIDRAFT_1216151 [Scleroderma citrinum Foug A]|uniref:Uncharacterized protein n=1 Tax=Scleroderma citrinum Foug A TaxID=1036808 RepID=A0A0C3A8Q5_9AGAM|nr:hypothetical protein SCLCIDRAFT_1216151 [Scleroderma citrinum Foug A]
MAFTLIGTGEITYEVILDNPSLQETPPRIHFLLTNKTRALSHYTIPWPCISRYLLTIAISFIQDTA